MHCELAIETHSKIAKNLSVLGGPQPKDNAVSKLRSIGNFQNDKKKKFICKVKNIPQSPVYLLLGLRDK